MKYTFEKFQGKDKWQVRVRGEFICYIHKHGNGLYTDTSETVWSSDKSILVDKILVGMGYKNKQHYFNEQIKQYSI